MLRGLACLSALLLRVVLRGLGWHNALLRALHDPGGHKAAIRPHCFAIPMLVLRQRLPWRVVLPAQCLKLCEEMLDCFGALSAEIYSLRHVTASRDVEEARGGTRGTSKMRIAGIIRREFSVPVRESHAPSPTDDELQVANAYCARRLRELLIRVHPVVVHDFSPWRLLGHAKQPAREVNRLRRGRSSKLCPPTKASQRAEGGVPVAYVGDAVKRTAAHVAGERAAHHEAQRARAAFPRRGFPAA
mmetsp:Transcript_79292/g.220477  ORF Transcript_79292/g.220477 Transcript_79292/m.220477 type:complete len:245 (-) Transcript_79292:1063-1797(-)